MCAVCVRNKRRTLLYHIRDFKNGEEKTRQQQQSADEAAECYTYASIIWASGWPPRECKLSKSNDKNSTMNRFFSLSLYEFLKNRMVIKKRDLLRGVDSAISKTNRSCSSKRRAGFFLICSCLLAGTHSKRAGRRTSVSVRVGDWGYGLTRRHPTPWHLFKKKNWNTIRYNNKKMFICVHVYSRRRLAYYYSS